MIKWLLLVTFLKQIIFAAIIPLWHGPDEQAHFAQVQYIAEFGHPTPNDNRIKDLSREIFISEELLGTNRDEFGKNKFTHHPEYRPEYTATTTGKYENLIKNLPLSSRTDFVKFEATRYPPLFYYLSAGFYRLGYNLDLISRVFLARFASIIMGILMVYFSFRLAELIFGHRHLLALTVATLVSFQPMSSFLFSSVNSDNLMNFLFTLWLYLSLKLITNPTFNLPALIGLAVTTVAGLLTKPHFVIVFPLLLALPLFIWPQLKNSFQKHRPQVLLAGLAFLGIIIIRLWPQIIALFQGQLPGFAEVGLRFLPQPNYNISLPQHILWTLRHTIAEVIPWYWGVFNWLGVTLPRTVNRVVNRLMIIAAAGFLVWLWKNRRPLKWQAPQLAFIFLQASSLIFFLILLTWDWLFVRSHGFPFGMQGRYYFPTIVSHMAFLLVGWKSLVPKSWWIKLFGLGMVILNFIGLHTLAKAYYQIWPVSVFLNQISQYKPVYFKFPYLLIWFTLYLASLSIFIVKYLTYADRQRSRI